MKKGVGLIPATEIHYVDHLGVIASIMGMPLLFVEEADYEIAKKYYPGIHHEIAEFNELNPEYLIANYDVLFMSDYWNRDEFHRSYELLEKKYSKRLRCVHCPHGFSDKGFYLRECVNEDITLVYGQNMLDMFKHEKVFEKLNSYVVTGNYRYTYFKKYKEFYELLVKEEIFNRLDRSKPTILYAPTWLDGEESTTFFDVPNHLFSQLPSDYNMIVKLHPHLELDDVSKYYHIIGKYSEKPNMIFLKDFPVYPLLACADIFISDLSSMGYDFLTFNRPMYFLNRHKRDKKTDRGLYLYRCGTEIMAEDYAKIYQVIANSVSGDQKKFSKIRSEVYQYTFGPERSLQDIKKDIIQACSSEAPFTNLPQ